jgi:hypothetical protein
MWESSGVRGWSTAYEAQLETWLSAVQDQEAGFESASINEVPLSTHMWASWDTGRFWLNYAARKSWAFAAVHWTFLDELFFGQRHLPEGASVLDLWRTRLHLLNQEEHDAMEQFVQRQMEESKQRILVEWEPEEARARLAELIFK